MNIACFLRRGAPSAAALALLLAATGCTPNTQYRYSGYVPAAHALAWDGRTAKEGTLRVEGTMVASTVDRNLTPVDGDTALRVPNVAVEGAVFLAPSRYFEIGVRYAYAAYGWGTASASGTLPLPSQPSLWGVGPEARATFPLDRHRRFAIGLAANVMSYETPYAEWQQPASGSCDTTAATCVFDSTTSGGTQTLGGKVGTYYQLFDEKTESHLALAFAVYPSVALGDDGELGHLFGGVTFNTGFRNDGFTNVPQNGSTIQQAALVPILAAGYGVHVDVVRVAGMLTLPLTSASSPINFGLGGVVTVGVDLALWDAHDDKSERRPPPGWTEPPRDSPE